MPFLAIPGFLATRQNSKIQCLSIHKYIALHINEYDIAKILTIIVHVVVKLLLHTKGKTKNQSWNKASFTEFSHDDIGSDNGTAGMTLPCSLMYMAD